MIPHAGNAPTPFGGCIHHLVQAQALRTPHAVAVTDGRQSLAYAELDARANRLAHHLTRLGVGPEARVGICQARRVDVLVSVLAVLKAGGAYVPLDPAYPAERLAFTLDDARVAVLLTETALAGVLPVPDGVPVVLVDGDGAQIAREPADDPAVRVSPRNLAYLIYTSGSTGVPKGVAIEHGNTVALLSWAARLHTDDELRGMLASTSLSFDLSVYELFLPLTRGGRVIMVENALALPASPAADQVRLINTVPSAAAALLRTGGIPPGVTTVNLAGEPLGTELVDALYAHGVHRVLDLYGPSETTTYSTFAPRRAGAPATIGRPIANTQAYVLDAALNPGPLGVPGELYLGGAGVARGYLGRPALTAERFVPDPFGGEAGGRLYRTGDRVRWRDVRKEESSGERTDSASAEAFPDSPSLTLEYLGRLDAQVKVRGFRVEPGEIEAVLRRHPDVRECLVVARDDAAGEARLIAYVVGDADAEPLRAHLRHVLPAYLVPAAFVRLDALPLTPNGKVDRAALPAPEPAETRRYEAPRTAVEAALADIWADLLGVERVGVHDGFFDLGGHSLLATRLVWRIRQALEGEVDVAAVFDAPTIAALAPRLSERRPRVAPAALASPRHLLERVDELADDELDRLLAAASGFPAPP